MRLLVGIGLTLWFYGLAVGALFALGAGVVVVGILAVVGAL